MRSTHNDPPALLDPFAGGGAIPLEAQRLGPVSYTHLDVYKRQPSNGQGRYTKTPDADRRSFLRSRRASRCKKQFLQALSALF